MKITKSNSNGNDIDNNNNSNTNFNNNTIEYSINFIMAHSVRPSPFFSFSVECIF